MPENMKIEQVQGLFDELDMLKEKLFIYAIAGLSIGKVVAEINKKKANINEIELLPLGNKP